MRRLLPLVFALLLWCIPAGQTAVLQNLCAMDTATTGTGTVTLGSAITGYLSFADCGVANNDVVTYAIINGNNREIGRGTYTAAGTTLSRTTILESTNADNAISLSGSSTVIVTPAAEDFLQAGDHGDITSDADMGLQIDASAVGAAEIATDGVSADELNATGVEAELEAVLDINQLQGEAAAANLAADSVADSELDGTAAFDITGSITFDSDALQIDDTNASHQLILTPGSDLTADHVLTLTTGDADRTVTISGAATISQDYSTTGNPQFATIELGAASDTTVARSGAGAVSVEGVGVALNSTSLTHTASTIELGAASDTTLARSAAGEVTVEGDAVKHAGKQTIWIPASAMTPNTTNGCAAASNETTTNDVMFSTCDFDTTTQESAQFSVALPKSWNEGTVTATVYWSHPSTAVNFGVEWDIACLSLSNDDALDQAFGTAVEVGADTGGTTDDVYVTAETGAITCAGTPAAEDQTFFRVRRVPADAGDTLAVDARLHGVKLYITDDASTDE